MTHNTLQEVEILKSENQELKYKLAALEEQNNEVSIILIDNAIKTGILLMGGRQSWIAIANNFPIDCREVLNSLKVSASSSREFWDIRKWEIEDPEGLQKMKNSMPHEYKKLFDSYYIKRK